MPQSSVTPNFTVEVRGHSELAAVFKNLFSALEEQRILDDLGAMCFARIRARFLSKLDPDNQPWVPSIAGRKREAAGGPGTGFDTGTLFHSLQLYAGDEPNTRGIGTDVFYGPYFQFGTRGGPERIFLGFGDEDRDLSEQMLIQRIEKAMKP